MDDYLTLFNMDAPHYVHRVQLAEKGEVISIKQTQITSTDDLFALVYNGHSYKLFKIDLNAYDLTKLEETKRNADSLFYEGTRKPVLEYTNEDVKN